VQPILLATDGSPTAQKATEEAFELAQALELPVVAVAVAAPPDIAYGYYTYAALVNEVREARDQQVEDVLKQTAAAAEEAGIDCETVASHGPVARTICGIAKERNARLIVIGAHGWGAMGRLLHGSVSTEVLHEASCPVLVVRGERVADERKALAETMR
jgi:nucleotide-binding universal stress UspA family protein